MSKSVNLASVAIPLVEIAGADGLSWSDRERCADALRKVLRHYNSMESERMGQILGAAIGHAQGSQEQQTSIARAAASIGQQKGG